MSSVDDVWEYEYDQNQTEVGAIMQLEAENRSLTNQQVFLVDLDLTSVNQAVRSNGANRHKRLNEIASTAVSKKQKISEKSNEQGSAATPVNVETTVADPDTSGMDQASPGSQDSVQPKSLQVLDLSTGNPIVAYGGEVLSCKWTDMVGTIMFFAYSQDVPLCESELSTADYDLIGTSRIKLVGTKTKLIPVPQQSVSTESTVPAGQGLGTIHRNNAKVNADLRKQASFLEQLMNVKKDRGETDSVFVVMNDEIAAAAAAGRLNMTAQAQKQKLETLNREAVKGSADAFQQIEQIYLSQHINDTDEDTISRPVETANPRARQRISRRPRVLGTASPSPGPMTSNLGTSFQQNVDTTKGDR